jgi:aspartyl-tRNA(Asn)/glutamyl-tRNA(Gln) amidotransferase subunit A
VEELDDPALCPPGSTAELAGGEIAAVHRTWRSEGLQYGSEISGRLEVAFQVTLDQYVEATHWRAAIRQRAAAALSRFDVLVTPTTGTTRKIIGDEMVETSDGAHHHRGVLSWFTALVNVAGLPAIAAPLAAESTPPPSLQIIGPWWGEHRLLEVAATLEREGITR